MILHGPRYTLLGRHSKGDADKIRGFLVEERFVEFRLPLRGTM